MEDGGETRGMLEKVSLCGAKKCAREEERAIKS